MTKILEGITQHNTGPLSVMSNKLEETHVEDFEDPKPLFHTQFKLNTPRFEHKDCLFAFYRRFSMNFQSDDLDGGCRETLIQVLGRDTAYPSIFVGGIYFWSMSTAMESPAYCRRDDYSKMGWKACKGDAGGLIVI